MPPKAWRQGAKPATAIARLAEEHDVELDYRREVRIEHRYLIGECRVAELGRSRVELDNRLLLPEGDVAVEGRAVLVAWDEQSRRSRELTEHERKALLSAEPERLRQ